MGGAVIIPLRVLHCVYGFCHTPVGGKLGPTVCRTAAASAASEVTSVTIVDSLKAETRHDPIGFGRSAPAASANGGLRVLVKGNASALVASAIGSG